MLWKCRRFFSSKKMDTESRLVLGTVIHRVQNFLCISTWHLPQKGRKSLVHVAERRDTVIIVSGAPVRDRIIAGRARWQTASEDPGPKHSKPFFSSIMPQRIRTKLSPSLPETGYSNWVSVQHHDLTLAGAQTAMITILKNSCTRLTFDIVLNVSEKTCVLAEAGKA